MTVNKLLLPAVAAALSFTRVQAQHAESAPRSSGEIPWPDCNDRNSSVRIELRADGTEKRMCVCTAPFGGENCETCADSNYFLYGTAAAAECKQCVAPEDSNRRTFQVSGVSESLTLPLTDTAACLHDVSRTVQYVYRQTIVTPSVDTATGIATGAVTCDAPVDYRVELVVDDSTLHAGQIRCIPQFEYVDQTFEDSQEPEVLHFHSLSPADGPVSRATEPVNPSSKVTSTGDDNAHTWSIVPSVIGVLVLIGLAGLCYWCFVSGRRRREDEDEQLEAEVFGASAQYAAARGNPLQNHLLAGAFSPKSETLCSTPLLGRQQL